MLLFNPGLSRKKNKLSLISSAKRLSHEPKPWFFLLMVCVYNALSNVLLPNGVMMSMAYLLKESHQCARVSESLSVSIFHLVIAEENIRQGRSKEWPHGYAISFSLTKKEIKDEKNKKIKITQ